MRTRTRLIGNALSLSALLLVLPAFCTAQETEHLKLSPSSQQAARIIGVEPLLARLSSLTAAKSLAGTGISLEELSLHQQITEAVVVASLEVDSVMDQIDNERAQIVELQSILLARRQRAIGTTNFATLALSTGLGALSGVLQFSDTTKGVGNAIGFAAGGLSTGLSLHSVRQQHGGARPAWVLPSMLAPFFREPREHSTYPADTWAYLNSVPEEAASQASRRGQLLAGWRRSGRFPPLDSPQAKSKIALLTGMDAADKRLSMDLLSERSAMLADVRDEVAGMRRVLGKLLREIRVSR
ncbi:MAG: hypothetical protein ABFD86_11990 [Bryobacteraceae bacterium]